MAYNVQLCSKKRMETKPVENSEDVHHNLEKVELLKRLFLLSKQGYDIGCNLESSLEDLRVANHRIMLEKKIEGDDDFEKWCHEEKVNPSPIISTGTELIDMMRILLRLGVHNPTIASEFLGSKHKLTSDDKEVIDRTQQTAMHCAYFISKKFTDTI